MKPPGTDGSPSPRRRTFRVLTYNVHGCVGVDRRLSPRRVGRVIERADADVVCLQELDLGRRRSRHVDQPRVLAELLGMGCVFHPSFASSAERFGNAVLSRHPLRLERAGPLPAGHRPSEPRAAMRVVVDLGGRSLRVLNTHLGLRAAERLLQARALAESWLPPEKPTVLCADLNASPRSPSYRHLRAALPVTSQGFRTWPSWLPLLRLDHILLSPELEAQDSRVMRGRLERAASDHLPVVLTARWPGEHHQRP